VKDLEAPVTVSLDGVANDGFAGQANNVRPDIETVYTGEGDDEIHLHPGPDFAGSGGGDDVVYAEDAPGAAPDSDGVDLGEGADYVYARDGVRDVINCGEVANDVADFDVDNGEIDFFGIDELVNCDDDAIHPDDFIDPGTTITFGPRSRGTRRTVRFGFESNEEPVLFKCKLTGRPLTSCNSPKTYRHLRPGRYKFSVYAIDEAGNRDYSPAKKRFRILR
jgi:hypothetical protein